MTDLISRSDDYLSHRRGLAYLAVAVLTACGLAYAIGPVLSSPNGHLYSFGGDALVLYYNAVYHVWYGAEGHVLDAMLYPEGELIYMTDAQGVLTVALQWLSRHVVDLRDYIVGVIHAVNIAAVLFAAPATYAVAARLGIHRALALLLVPSIVLLSPRASCYSPRRCSGSADISGWPTRSSSPWPSTGYYASSARAGGVSAYPTSTT